MKKNLLPLIILIITNLLIGIFIVDDFGESWDEQSLREYTDLSIEAYHEGFSDLEASGFFHENILRYYGPAYLLLASGLINLFEIMGSHMPVIDLWHFANFLSFHIAIVSFYFIARRFLKPWACFTTVMLFSTQPLFWGHAFINPKDIPFLSFFLAAVASGFWMVDAASVHLDERQKKTGSTFQSGWMSDDWKGSSKFSRTIYLVTVIFLFLMFVLLVFHSWVRDHLLFSLIDTAYNAGPGTLLDSLFIMIAGNANSVSADLYVEKAAKLLLNFELIAVILMLVSMIGISMVIFKKTAAWILDHYIITFFRKALKQLLSPHVLLAGVLLGVCVSIRAIGPAAGLLVACYLFSKMRKEGFPLLPVYCLSAIVVTVLTWPYLWGNAFHRYFESMLVMSQFPFGADVLFQGRFFHPDGLPFTYLPLLLVYQFTEPALLLFFVGLFVAVAWFWRDREKRIYIAILSGWVFVPVILIMLVRPPLYDNFRQFLFITPPIFFIAGMAIDAVMKKIRNPLLNLVLLIILIIPGILADIQLHPYPYVYFNHIAGGVRGAFRQYELDYWATSFKEATEYVNRAAPNNAKVITSEPVHIVRNYAREDLVIDLYPSGDEPVPQDYDYVILTTRLDRDRLIYPESEIVFKVSRDGADFAVVKKNNQ